MTSTPLPLVLCAKKPQRGIKGAFHPRVEGYKNIDVTSGQPKTRLMRQLSPFFLGPIPLLDDIGINLVSVCLENAWQGLKVYPGEWNDTADTPTVAWLSRLTMMCASSKPMRHTPGIEKGVKPLGHYYHSRLIGIEEARKKIYIPFYTLLARKTEAYSQLKYRVVKESEKVQILDYDGRALSDSWDEDVANVSVSLGHGMVLTHMLLMDIIADGVVAD